MPASLEIQGGVPLTGTVAVSAAKNAALPALACALLTPAAVSLPNVPGLGDVRTMLRLLEQLGATGVRPIDQHLKGLAKLGAEIAIENGYVVARARRLKAAKITTDLVTVTGTENLMMAAALADGTTVIENAAREPEVADLAALLTAMGAKLDGVGTGHIEIQGVPALGGATHRVVADRIEAGTLIVAGPPPHRDVAGPG